MSLSDNWVFAILSRSHFHNQTPDWNSTVCLSECASEARAAVCLTGVVSKNNDGDHLLWARKSFYYFLYPSSPVLVYCSHSFEFPLPILCAPGPGNAVIYSDMQPANHTPSSSFLFFLSSSCLRPILSSVSVDLPFLSFCSVSPIVFSSPSPFSINSSPDLMIMDNSLRFLHVTPYTTFFIMML